MAESAKSCGISELEGEGERLISDLFQIAQDNVQASSLVRVPFSLLGGAVDAHPCSH